MRSALLTGLLLLAIALLGGPSSPTATATKPRASGVQVFATGGGLPPERDGLRALPQAVVVDDAVYALDAAETGLRAATIVPGQGVTELVNFGAEDAGKLLDHCARVPPDAALALFSYGAARGEPESPAALADALRSLGATSPPSSGESWALLTVREPGGWVPLAEARSDTRGVHIAYLLAGDLGRLDAPPGGAWRDDRERLSLIESLDRASLRTDPFVEVTPPNGWIGNEPVRAILAHPPYGEKGARYPDGSNRIVWDDLPLGRDPRFESLVGISSWVWGRGDGVVFSVLVNGEIVAGRVVGADEEEPNVWHRVTADLSRWAGRRVSLEMRVDPRGTTYFDHALWGEPAIVSSRSVAERSPSRAESARSSSGG